ncbi:hypothetical protein BC829DRAFT_392982 [Chytridium lagenaria]|nr:hypothetical protein BC829DRAFT_392982 [Chytridium lagenaria]
MVVLVVKRGEDHVLNVENYTTSDILKHGLLKHGLLNKSIKELEDADDDDDDEDVGTVAKIQDPNVGTLMTVEGRTFIFNPDPTGQRNGESPIPDIANTLRTTLDDASKLLDKEYAKSGKFLTESDIQESIRLIGGALTIAYPMGLPSGEPAKILLDDKEDIEDIKDYIPPFEASLWWAGRELQAAKTLSEFIGKNEKTKIIVKLQRKSQGAPVREPPLDEMSQRNLMAYYYKKQELDKKLAENKDDDYLNSSWANPGSLKQAFNGLSGGVDWKP